MPGVGVRHRSEGGDWTRMRNAVERGPRGRPDRPRRPHPQSDQRVM